MTDAHARGAARAPLREVSLTWTSGGRWRAAGDGVDVEHADLPALEALVAERLAPAGAERVAMRFDFASLPAWLRQHQSHYFNYVLTIAPARRSVGE